VGEGAVVTESTGNNDPFFVGGAGRSGTSLMRVMSDSHPRICCGPDLKLLSGIAEQYQMFIGPRVRPILESYGNMLSDVQGWLPCFHRRAGGELSSRCGQTVLGGKTPYNVLVHGAAR